MQEFRVVSAAVVVCLASATCAFGAAPRAELVAFSGDTSLRRDGSTSVMQWFDEAVIGSGGDVFFVSRTGFIADASTLPDSDTVFVPSEMVGDRSGLTSAYFFDEEAPGTSGRGFLAGAANRILGEEELLDPFSLSARVSINASGDYAAFSTTRLEPFAPFSPSYRAGIWGPDGDGLRNIASERMVGDFSVIPVGPLLTDDGRTAYFQGIERAATDTRPVDPDQASSPTTAFLYESAGSESVTCRRARRRRGRTACSTGSWGTSSRRTVGSR